MSPTVCYDGNSFTNDGYEINTNDTIAMLQFVHQVMNDSKIVITDKLVNIGVINQN